MNFQFIKKIQIDWDKIDKNSYLRNIPALKNLESLDFSKPITFFSGENGSGKSTLLEAMAISAGFNPEGGTKNYNFSTYDSHSELSEALTISRGVCREKHGYFLRAESFYNVATKEEEYADIIHQSEKFHEKSHGESFLRVAEKYLSANGLYFFDEPESSLSPQKQLTLFTEIYECAYMGSQFIIATHSPILLGIPDSQIYCFDDGKIHPCKYEETETYKISEMFINHRNHIIKELLGD